MNKRQFSRTEGINFAHIGQVFLFLTASLIIFVGAYWIFLLEPQIHSHSRTQSALIAQSQSWILADAIEHDNSQQLLQERMDEILILTDPETEAPFIHGINIEIDADNNNAINISRGNTDCGHCYVIKSPLYSTSSRELIGIATFYTNDDLFIYLRDNIRDKIILSILFLMLFIAIAGFTIWKLISRARIKDKNLSSIFDTIPFPMIISSPELDATLYFNQAAGRMFQLGSNSIEAITPTTFFSDASVLDMIRSRTDDRTLSFESSIQTASAGQIWSLTTLSPLVFNDKPAKIIAFVDITATKDARDEINESRKRFSAIVDGLEDHVYVIRDDNGQLMFSNITPDEVNSFEQCCKPDTCANDCSCHEAEGMLSCQFFNPSSHRWYSARHRFIDWIDGQPVRLVTLTDITKLISTQLDLENEKQKAETASRAKSEFLATMSHEIRTPMNGIIGMLNLLKRTRLTQQQAEYLDTIDSSSKQLLLLLNDILDISKIESGKLVLEQTPFELKPLVEDCMHLIENRASEKHIALDIDISPDIPQALIGDEMRLRQVLLNLLGNAIKFTDQGYIKCAVNLLARDEDRVRLLFSVMDTGIGIADDKQHALFELFSQLDSSTSRKYGGSGLGLAICKNLVTAMQGDIGYRSNEGEGSHFFFTLELPIPPSLSSQVSSASAASLALPHLSILLAEDNEINSYAARTLLEQDGHTVSVVRNGEQACQAVMDTGQSFDVVLMDIHMPEVDGIEATRRIRRLDDSRKRAIPIIALTANILQEEKRKCIEAGMNGFVAKPFSPDQLINTLHSVLQAKAGAEGPIALE